ncbi:CoA transferase [Nocardia sp. NPDC050193]
MDSATAGDTPGPLSGLRVVDLTTGIAGPYCTKLLADFGAEVVKVEHPGAGDPSRAAGPFPGGLPDPRASGQFLHLNTSKAAITVDLEQSAGGELVRRLTACADIVVENSPPGAMARFGLDYPSLRSLDPSLVLTSVTGFGPTGPYRDYLVTDAVAFALGGWMATQGEPDREPLYAGGPYASYLAGQYAAFGTVLAALGAEVSGFGQHVEVSILEVAVDSLLYDTVGLGYTGHIRGRQGNRFGAPWLALPVRDGYVGIASLREWDEFWIVLLGTDDIPRHPLAAQDPDERQVLTEQLWQRTAHIGKREFFETAQALRILACEILELDEVLDSPQYRARNYFRTLPHATAGELVYPGPPARLPASPWRLGNAAPEPGADNDRVFTSWLGIETEELVLLRERGVI